MRQISTASAPAQPTPRAAPRRGSAGSPAFAPNAIAARSSRLVKPESRSTILLLLAVAAYVFQFIQVGWLITLKPVQPSLSKLDPIKGAKKLVNLSSWFKAALSVVKLAIIVLVVAMTIYQSRR